MTLVPVRSNSKVFTNTMDIYACAITSLLDAVY